MFNSQIVKAENGQFFVFRIPGRETLSQSLTPKYFWDDFATLHFVQNLNVMTGFWHQLASSCLGFGYEGWRNAHPWSAIEEYIAYCLINGHIQVFSIKADDVFHPSSSERQFKTPYGISYQFIPAANTLISSPSETKSFNSVADANTFIENLNLSDKQLSELEESLDLPEHSTGANAGGFAYTESPKQNLSNALVNGDIIIAVEEEANKPASKDNFVETKTTPVDLGPHATEATSETAAEEQKQEEPVCKLTKFTVSCAHDGRKQEVIEKTAGILSLDVVASETAKRGFEKIKAKLEVDSACSTHTSSSSTIHPAPAKTVKGSLENTYHLSCEPVTNPLRYLWLPSIKPSTYKIAASACERYSPASVEVNVFPKVKWNANIAYSFGGKESKREANSTGVVSNEHSSKAGKFSGKMEFFYDEEKRDLTLEYKNGIDDILQRLNYVRRKVDRFLTYMGDDAPLKLEIFWPNLGIKYETELKEDKSSPEVVSSYDLSLSADPLIGMKGSIDVFPVLLKAVKTHPAGRPIASVLEAALKGVGSDKSVASLKADIQLVFSIESKVTINFSTSGENGKDNASCKSEQAIAMEFKFEGVVGAKGHIWVIKFEKSYKAGIKTGFVGKIIIERDDVGYYWYSRFLFNGLIVYFTKYEKLEKSVTGGNPMAKALGKVPDQAEESTTTEFTWIEPDADEEAPADTATAAGSPATQSANRHYIIKF
ncbi:hypothetical protein [Aliikangiella coralliicola]|uniref:Uncharacterized protein n=1 Tax=Aliikangiella coralliicola TaxID=2592383 RepID=A0A545U8Z5_9GAMM|nr:hypothetical protein [Aliikangiella coralliicola]TQV85883.1 hypothetical protein FLL46_18340 [Aliikangiella coralliicola]